MGVLLAVLRGITRVFFGGYLAGEEKKDVRGERSETLGCIKLFVIGQGASLLLI